MKLRIPVFTASLMIAALGTITAGTRAAPLTFYFEGHVTRLHDSITLDDSVYIGAPFSGGYTFDPIQASDSYPDNPHTGNYYFPPPARIWAEIGNYAFVTEDLIMFIVNDSLSGDLYEPISITPFMAAGIQWGALSVLLQNESGSALDSDVLPLDAPSLEVFEHRGFLIELPGGELGIGGRLTSLTPEPGSLVLLALGAIAGCWRRENR